VAHQRDRLALKQLLEDFSKLESNLAWHQFLKYVATEAQQAMRELAKETYTEQKLRYWQGFYRALKLVVEEYPDRFFKEIQKEIEK